jgi:hypothetical protein
VSILLKMKQQFKKCENCEYTGILQKYQVENGSLTEQLEKLKAVQKSLPVYRNVLITQISFRITERLRSQGLPKACWNWVSVEPLDALLSGKVVRIKIYETDDYYAANVSFIEQGDIKIELVKCVKSTLGTAEVTGKALDNMTTPEDATILKQWQDKNMPELMAQCADAAARGHTEMKFKVEGLSEKLLPRLVGCLKLMDADL